MRGVRGDRSARAPRRHAVTNPIPLPASPSARWRGVDVPDAVLERLRGVCALSVDAGSLADAGRDWWPLALTWALDGVTPASPAGVARPSSAAEVAAVLRICNEARVPVTAAGGRSGVCGARSEEHTSELQ